MFPDNQSPLHCIFAALLDLYGPQGWWPLLDVAGKNPTATGVMQGYHPGDFSFPHTPGQQFEIALGAILTQNTSWTNVEKALANLHRDNRLSAEGISSLDDERLKALIRPAGYFNQKARKIRHFCELLESLGDEVPSREQLLSVWGVGPETADSILLYAWREPVFVVDAYTRRILSHLGLVPPSAGYADIQALFHWQLDRDWRLYQEYHALLVEHAKHFYRKKPWGKQITADGGELFCPLAGGKFSLREPALDSFSKR